MMTRFSARYQRPKEDGTKMLWSRFLEDMAFLLGVFLIGSKGIVEVLQDASILPHHEHSFGSIMLEFGRNGLLVAPKMLGRATAGRAWVALTQRFGKKPVEGDDA